MIVRGDPERRRGPNDAVGPAATGHVEAAAGSTAESIFPRARRLLRPAEFSVALSAPAAFRASAFALHVAVRSKPSTVPDAALAWRLGLVIPKRFVASAARRNAIKRRWREAFRLRAASLDEQFAACDLVVRLTARLAASKQPKQALHSVFDAPRMIEQLVAGRIATAVAKRGFAKRAPR